LLYRSSTQGDIETLEIALNDKLEKTPISGSSQIEIEMEEDAVITINGEDITLEELLNADEEISLNYSKIKVAYDTQKRTASSISLDEEMAPDLFAAKVDVDIEVSFPPFKIKITIKW
jgi:type VI protein secretion system component Hcp